MDFSSMPFPLETGFFKDIEKCLDFSFASDSPHSEPPESFKSSNNQDIIRETLVSRNNNDLLKKFNKNIKKYMDKGFSILEVLILAEKQGLDHDDNHADNQEESFEKEFHSKKPKKQQKSQQKTIKKLKKAKTSKPKNSKKSLQVKINTLLPTENQSYSNSNIGNIKHKAKNFQKIFGQTVIRFIVFDQFSYKAPIRRLYDAYGLKDQASLMSFKDWVLLMNRFYISLSMFRRIWLGQFQSPVDRFYAEILTKATEIFLFGECYEYFKGNFAKKFKDKIVLEKYLDCIQKFKNGFKNPEKLVSLLR